MISELAAQPEDGSINQPLGLCLSVLENDTPTKAAGGTTNVALS